jgi:hypothetical protein
VKPKTKLLALATFVGIVLIATAVLVLVFPDIVRVRILKPLIEAYYIGRYYLAFVPQLVLWMIPPVIVTLLMLRHLLRLSRKDRSTRVQPLSSISPGEAELARLSQQLRRARHSRFARVRLSRTLVEIGARLIASREGMPLWQARRRLTEGYWRGHLTIHQFLTPQRHYTSRESGAGFEQSLQEVIEYLEEFEHHV